MNKDSKPVPNQPPVTGGEASRSTRIAFGAAAAVVATVFGVQAARSGGDAPAPSQAERAEDAAFAGSVPTAEAPDAAVYATSTAPSTVPPAVPSTTALQESTTTTMPERMLANNEILPQQHMGVLSVTISGEGADRPVIEHQLFADSRSNEQIANLQPVEPEDTMLRNGFMLHRDSYVPGVREVVYDANNPDLKYATLIAGHRMTLINYPHPRSVVMRDIDKIQINDPLAVQLHGVPPMEYRAVAKVKIPYPDTGEYEIIESITDNIFNQDALGQGATPTGALLLRKSDKESIILYACDTSAEGGVPVDQRYSPDVRYYVVYERAS